MLNQNDLFAVRKVKHLTAEDMGSLLGISQSYYTRIEKGKVRLTERIAKKIVQLFDLTPEKLRDYRKRWDEYQRMKAKLKAKKRGFNEEANQARGA